MVRKRQRNNGWKELDSVPKDGTYVQLLMDSGYTTTPYAIIIAQYVKEYHKSPWRDHSNDSVFDGYSTIVAWKPWKVPELDFTVEQGNGQYYFLKDGDKIEIGDQFKRGEDWVTLDQADINGWQKVTGKELIHRKGETKVRRLGFK